MHNLSDNFEGKGTTVNQFIFASDLFLWFFVRNRDSQIYYCPENVHIDILFIVLAQSSFALRENVHEHKNAKKIVVKKTGFTVTHHNVSLLKSEILSAVKPSRCVSRSQTECRTVAGTTPNVILLRPLRSLNAEISWCQVLFGSS